MCKERKAICPYKLRLLIVLCSDFRQLQFMWPETGKIMSSYLKDTVIPENATKHHNQFSY